MPRRPFSVMADGHEKLHNRGDPAPKHGTKLSTSVFYFVSFLWHFKQWRAISSIRTFQAMESSSSVFHGVTDEMLGVQAKAGMVFLCTCEGVEFLVDIKNIFVSFSTIFFFSTFHLVLQNSRWSLCEVIDLGDNGNTWPIFFFFW